MRARADGRKRRTAWLLSVLDTPFSLQSPPEYLSSVERSLRNTDSDTLSLWYCQYEYEYLIQSLNSCPSAPTSAYPYSYFLLSNRQHRECTRQPPPKYEFRVQSSDFLQSVSRKLRMSLNSGIFERSLRRPRRPAGGEQRTVPLNR
eukprot:scaffold370043_cov37-Prasinocladus_malaysianus.AAC.1